MFQVPIELVDCKEYKEDACVCYSDGEPKGQCVCGAKWYEHDTAAIKDENDRLSARRIQEERGIKYL